MSYTQDNRSGRSSAKAPRDQTVLRVRPTETSNYKNNKSSGRVVNQEDNYSQSSATRNRRLLSFKHNTTTTNNHTKTDFYDQRKMHSSVDYGRDNLYSTYASSMSRNKKNQVEYSNNNQNMSSSGVKNRQRLLNHVSKQNNAYEPKNVRTAVNTGVYDNGYDLMDSYNKKKKNYVVRNTSVPKNNRATKAGGFFAMKSKKN
jgi:hypothetical protein